MGFSPLNSFSGLPPLPSTIPNIPRVPLFLDQFASGWLCGWGNDGKGATYLDTLITFNGAPTMRLVTDSGVSGQAGTTPSTPDPTTANVTKRRLAQFSPVIGGSDRSKYFFSLWWFPSFRASDNLAFTMGLYSRETVNRIQANLWPKYSDKSLNVETGGVATFKQIGIRQSTLGSIAYDQNVGFATTWDSASPGTGQAALAGNWHYLELGIDFKANTYLYAVFDEVFFNLSQYTLNSVADTATAGLVHFTLGITPINSVGGTLGWVSIAQPIGGYIL